MAAVTLLRGIAVTFALLPHGFGFGDSEALHGFVLLLRGFLLVMVRHLPGVLAAVRGRRRRRLNQHATGKRVTVPARWVAAVVIDCASETKKKRTNVEMTFFVL